MRGGGESNKMTFFPDIFPIPVQRKLSPDSLPCGAAFPLFDFHLKGISTSKVKIVDS